jgi:hypothetical protein
MKKFLLFFSSMALVMSTYAGSYIPTELGSIVGGSQITSVDGVTLTIGGTDNVPTYAAYALNYNSVDYVGYFGGSANPVLTSGIPTTGCFYKFDMTKSGSLDVCYVLNASKPFYILEVSGTTINTLVNGTTTTAKVYQGTTITVTSGNSYYVYCTGSKLGLFGFSFTEGSTPSKVTNLTNSDVIVVKTEYFTTTGAKLEEPIKGINIVKETMSDGKVVTSKIIK